MLQKKDDRYEQKQIALQNQQLQEEYTLWQQKLRDGYNQQKTQIQSQVTKEDLNGFYEKLQEIIKQKLNVNLSYINDWEQQISQKKAFEVSNNHIYQNNKIDIEFNKFYNLEIEHLTNKLDELRQQLNINKQIYNIFLKVDTFSEVSLEVNNEIVQNPISPGQESLGDHLIMYLLDTTIIITNSSFEKTILQLDLSLLDSQYIEIASSPKQNSF